MRNCFKPLMACVDEGFTYLFDVALAKTPFSRNLKSLRRARGLSQQKLAQEVGLKRSNIASYETGTVEPNAANFLRIAYFFDADPALLLELELSDHPVLTTDNHQRQEDILEMLSRFSSKTNDADKVAQGFREYLLLHPKQEKTGNLKAVLDILERIVAINKRFMGH
ncbi:helix-turn-helix transcriptional regulator [Phaeodactylibacter sp.]|uniref:helix-turn-helix domain-containing protein n=2 Tax=Phaeodactylibacter sp. TaxID=1940289 RepID=UPI0025DFDF63|nr:helix-turn-helix transcriptional regulator [Phaeodactylibacter sp.]